MPVRPENVARYPADWRKISERIRFVRAAGRCECRGECGLDHHGRCDARDGRSHPMTGSKVVLTVAHLDHQPEHCAESNLLAMCQQCHNHYDMPERTRGRAARLRALRAIADLFDSGPATDIRVRSPACRGWEKENG